MEKGIVLLVEDNQKILDINRRMLEKDGFIVLTAKTLDEARARIKIVSPDVAVIDIMLPDGNGIDFLQELREVSNAPALFLTAKAERLDVIRGLTAGGNDYITKPYDIDEFRARIINFMKLAKSKNMQTASDENKSSILTDNELSIALYAAKGMSNKDIAAKVYLSESRIKTSLSTIYRKLGITEEKDKRHLLNSVLHG